MAVAPSPEWVTVHAVADKGIPAMTSALIDAWDAQRNRIDVSVLAASLEAYGHDNIDWRTEIIALQGAMVSVCGSIARDTALALIPRYETVKGSETFAMPGWMDVAFDLRFMEAETFLTKYLPMLVVNVNNETRIAIRNVVLEGFRKGHHPYQMAEEIKALVGMTPGQVRAYQAFAANLARRNMSRDWQSNALKNYRERAIERRARNIARTETLRAANAGQLRLWQVAGTNGLLGPSAKKLWINTPGPRTCPTCQGMGGRTADINGVWSVEGYSVEAPPLHPSCRCAMGLTFDDPWLMKL